MRLSRSFASDLLLTVLLAVAIVPSARAQLAQRAAQPWRTVETEHFSFHFPEPLAEWALPMIRRFEAVRAVVAGAVGSVPERRVTVVLDDPVTLSNGLAFPDLNSPAMLFLATPPGPRSQIGNSRGWSELLAVHEFAHIAHLTRPSRRPIRRFLDRFLVGFGPIAQNAPRWVQEGYATYLEGELTGSGRPHGAWRAAVLRQWALEGKLPSYESLSTAEAYDGDAFAYLMGSAYLQWLTARYGDSSLVYLWRRLSARTKRSFAEAFVGLYGDAPEDLYARFQVDLTVRAVQARHRLEAAGLIEGETVQALAWETGDPALSRDGRYIAAVVRSRRGPSRLVVWNAEEEPADTGEVARRARRDRARDPEDVPDIIARPPRKRPVAVLYPASGGREHDAPRFMPDGKRILLVRMEPLADGSAKPDLFLWDYRRNELRRVTRGAAITAADPTPDGRAAIGVRCNWGKCGLARVDLASGTVSTLVEGRPDVTFYRPRVSPDGHWIAVAVQRQGRWRTELRSIDGRLARIVGGADSAEHYDAAFTPDGASLVDVSEAGGVPNIERIDLQSGYATSLTRVTGAAMAPEPSADGYVYFLRLHSKGLDLARVRTTGDGGPAVALPSELAPVAPMPPVAADTFAVEPVRMPNPYGLGNRLQRWSPILGYDRGGLSGGFFFLSTDPVGRLDWLLQARLGAAAWNGGSLRVALRRFTPFTIEADMFAVHQALPHSGAAPLATTDLDATFRGGWLALVLTRRGAASSTRVRVGAAIAQLETDVGRPRWRRLAHMDATAARSYALGGALDLTGMLNADAVAGTTGSDHWQRGIISASISARGRSATGFGLILEALRGQTRGSGGPFEDFLVGGEAPQLFEHAILSQRIELPAVPAGIMGGRGITTARAQLQGMTVAPYFWAARVDGSGNRWMRVLGIEEDLGKPPMPLFRTPGVSSRIGLGYSLDEMPGRKLRFYAGAILQP